MNTARKMLCSLSVAALAFAVNASAATTIFVNDEFGAPVRSATVTVTSMDLSSATPAGMSERDYVTAQELPSGGYLVNGVSGVARIDFNHPAYGQLMVKGDFENTSIQLIVGAAGGGFSLHHPGATTTAPASATGPTQNVGGDTCALATSIPWATILLPGGYTDSGGTGTADNAGVTCGANGSDVFYTFTTPAGANQCLRLTTCQPNSPADTVLQVKSSGCAATLACNDDLCNPIPPGGNIIGWNSTINAFGVIPNTTYNVQIDNFGLPTTNGNYTLNIQVVPGPCVAPVPPPTLVCPAGATLENEPNCGINSPPLACAANDTVNGGCNFVPNRYSALACGQTYCSTAGNCGFTRDVDWYETTEASLQIHTWCCTSEAPLNIFTIEPSGTPTSICPITATPLNNPATAANGWTGCVSKLAIPGKHRYGTSLTTFGGVPCGADYQCTLTCVCPPSCGGGATSGGTNFDGDAGRDR